jgi:hypothetical protein
VLTTLLRLLYPITNNCYTITALYGSLYDTYLGTLQTQPELVLYNIAYHFGLIYEDVMYVAGEDILTDDLQPLDTLSERDRYNQVGKHAGDIFTEIFGNTGGYEYPDVTIDYPVEFSWDLDNSIILGENEL